MDNKKIDKKKLLQVVPFAVMALFVVGLLSYATLAIDFEGLKISGVTKPEVSVSYEEKSNALDLKLTPLSDEQGKTQTNYFEFSVDASGKIDGEIPANIYIKEITKDIDNSNIKMYLTRLENGTETQVLAPTTVNNLKQYKEDTNSYLLNTKKYSFNSTTKTTYSDTYRLRVWLKADATLPEGSYTTKEESDGSITAETTSVSYSFKVNVSTKSLTTGADTIIAKVGTDGIVAESHPATTQLAATTDYRYTGANPNNYIKFNNETWRIIGVFDVDDGTGKLEKRIKIIRSSLGSIAWDSNRVNDWTTATGMQLLNTGDYWNRTGDYASTGLTENAKSMIEDAKWYLGGIKDYDSASNGLASHFYSYERGTTVYSGRPTSWVGKVGLMYPSDYGYATSGGTTTSRVACLAKEIYNWDSSEVSDCKNNDWLYDSSTTQWTLAPYSGTSRSAFGVDRTGVVLNGSVDNAYAFRPCVNLSSDIEITGGSGTSASPYEISK